MLALITGASSGIGFHLAREFATHGYDLVIVANEDAIFSAADKLRAEGVKVDAYCLDLSVLANVQSLANSVDSLDALVLNAGAAVYGDFVRKNSLDDHLRMISLNVVSVVALTKLLIPKMLSRGEGRVLITSSIAALMPGPLYATYAASKAFLLSFSEALRNELLDTRIRVTCLMPGATDTGIFARSGMLHTVVAEGDKDAPEDVARQAFAALMRGDHAILAASFRTKIEGTFAKMLPLRLLAILHRRKTRPVHA